jgi:hypothetical protein
MIADKILHSRVIGVLSRSAYLPDGLLIASDTQRKTRLFHFTSEEIVSLFNAFLNDEVTREEDGYVHSEGKLHGTLKVFAIRA